MISKALAIISVIFLGTVVTVVSAQTQGYGPPTEIVKESLPATPLVYAADGFVWVALTVYVFMLWRRIGRVERELADVNAKLTSRR